MNILKVGKKYRLRQMINGKTYSMMLDHKPTEREAYLLMADKSNKKNYGNVLVGEAVETYLSVNTKTFSPSTLRNYKNLLSNLKQKYAIMNLKIAELDDLKMQSFINEYSSEHSPKSVRNAYGLLRVAIRKFIKGYSPEINLPKKIKYMPYIPTDEDIKNLLAYVHGTQYETIIMLGLMGLRMSEILGLDIKDIDDGKITINKALVRGEYGMELKSTKTYSSTRIIPVSKTLTDLIKKQGYITKCNQASIENFFRRNYKKYCKEYFSFHKCRHYWASKMAEKVSPAALKEFGGWSSYDTPNKFYIHSIGNENNQKANIDYFDALTPNLKGS